MHMRISERIASVLLSTAALTQLAACGAAEPDDRHDARIVEQTPTPVSHSNVDLFDGIFLGQGPVAAVLPEIWGEMAPQSLAMGPVTSAVVAEKLKKLSQRMRENGMSANADAILTQAANIAATGKTYPAVSHAEIVAQVESLHQRIAEVDPSFLGEFARDIRSGKRPLVQRALQRAHYVLEKAGGKGSGSDNTWCNKCGEDIGGGGNDIAVVVSRGGGSFVFIDSGGLFLYNAIIWAGLVPSTPGDTAATGGLILDELVDLLADRMPLLGPATSP